MTFILSFIAICTWLNWFATEYVVSSSVNIPRFLTIFTKYSLKIFAFSDSSSIIASFSTNLITALPFTLLEKSLPEFFVISHRLYMEICKMIFFGFFQEANTKTSCYCVSIEVCFVTEKVLAKTFFLREYPGFAVYMHTHLHILGTCAFKLVHCFDL